MFNLIKLIEEKIKHRATLKICSRCNLFYKKTLDTCPHCYALDDETLLREKARRSYFRLNLGKSMLLGAAIVFVLMLLI